LIGSISWLLFFAFITWNELRAVLRQKEITREVISMSISTYLMLGLTCGLFYIVLHDLQPNAFSFGSGAPLTEQQTIPVLIYFSLTTLSTIGFGDITPITLQARYAAVAEGITGQFYLAILVGVIPVAVCVWIILRSRTPDQRLLREQNRSRPRRKFR